VIELGASDGYERKNTVHDMMAGGAGGMMWGMGIGGLLVITLLVLGIAALIKYLFRS
jgi:hypothetical protein